MCGFPVNTQVTMNSDVLGPLRISTLHYNLSREFHREGILSERDFLPGLSCSFPLQKKQQAAAKCSVNGSIHTGSEGREEGGKI